MTEVKSDQESRRFVISGEGYVSCLGFDVVFHQTSELAKRLISKGIPALLPSPIDIGTMEQYAQYKELLALYGNTNDQKTWFDNRTPINLQVRLEAIRKAGERVRIFYGDRQTGKDWCSEHDMIGRIGRSTGIMKSPLLVADNDIGGGAILTDCILKIVLLSDNSILYRAKNYKVPKLEIINAPDYENEEFGITHQVIDAEESQDAPKVLAGFKSKQKALNWLLFMTGETHVCK